MDTPTHSDWTGTTIEPTTAKKLAGWLAGEKPPHQYMNWLFNEQDSWNKWLDFLSKGEGCFNVGVSYSAGTFKMVQADGTDFSTDEPGFIFMQSQVTQGKKVLLQVTAATHLFVDDAGASDIVGEQFGVTSGVAWGSDRPFFIYAVNGGDTNELLRFAISPNPAAKQSPATANIGYHANPAATPSDNNFFFFTETDPTTTHDAVPALNIGSIRMRMSTSDDWTVQALAYDDGIGRDHEEDYFDLPLGQNGASAGTYMYPNGGTAAIFTTNVYKYQIKKNGICKCSVLMDADGGTDGAGAVDSKFAMPYYNVLATQTIFATGAYTAVGAATDFICIYPDASLPSFRLYAGAGASVIQNASFSNGPRYIMADFEFKAF